MEYKIREPASAQRSSRETETDGAGAGAAGAGSECGWRGGVSVRPRLSASVSCLVDERSGRLDEWMDAIWRPRVPLSCAGAKQPPGDWFFSGFSGLVQQSRGVESGSEKIIEVQVLDAREGFGDEEGNGLSMPRY